MSAETLQVENVSKRFDGVQAVDGISFGARRGEILGLLGPNGAGKTTTIRMLMGILRPDEGHIHFDFGQGPQALDKRRIGYLPEERGLYDDAPVLDMLVYLAGLKGLPKADARERGQRWLERLSLEEWSKRKVEKLSKGMQQKVQFLVAILHHPELVVLDEPFSGLDPINQDFFMDIVRELKQEGMAVLLSSHQMNQVEALCDRILLINKGQTVLAGLLSDLKEAHGEHAVRLRFSGDGSFLQNNPNIKELDVIRGQASFSLPKGIEPDDFVRSIPQALTIHEIELKRPPLHDIFVRAISGDHDERS